LGCRVRVRVRARARVRVRVRVGVLDPNPNPNPNLGEGAEVRDHRRRDEHVARHVGQDLGQPIRGLRPAHPLAAQPADECLRALELVGAIVDLVRARARARARARPRARARG